MSLWNTRNEAIAELDGPLKVEAEVLSEGFDLLDECVVRLETEHGSEPYSRVCALTLIKGRNLLLGSYSLSLDVLAQEAGALLRPFIEVFEKMVYFNDDPSRIDEAIEGRLPKAGEIAKRIQGQFKALREHLTSTPLISGSQMILRTISLIGTHSSSSEFNPTAAKCYGLISKTYLRFWFS